MDIFGVAAAIIAGDFRLHLRTAAAHRTVGRASARIDDILFVAGRAAGAERSRVAFDIAAAALAIVFVAGNVGRLLEDIEWIEAGRSGVCHRRSNVGQTAADVANAAHDAAADIGHAAGDISDRIEKPWQQLDGHKPEADAGADRSFLQDVLALFVGISLVSSIIFVPLNKFYFSRRYGIYLIGLYVVFLVTCILIECKVITNPF